MRRKLFTLLTVLGMASFASMAKGQTITYYIVTTASPTTTSAGTWQVYANVSDDNDGLSAYTLDVLGTGGATITGISTQESPEPRDTSFQYASGNGGHMGFNDFRNAGTIGVASNNGDSGLIGIAVAQDTVYGSSDDSSYDMGILVGVGQEPANASPQNGSQGPWTTPPPPDNGGPPVPTGLAVSATTPWAWTAAGVSGGGQAYAGTLIEQGTYTDNTAVAGTLLVQASNGTGLSTVLGTDPVPNELWGYEPLQVGDTPQAIVIGGGTVVGAVPEPASIGLLTLGLGMIASGRKIRRSKTA